MHACMHVCMYVCMHVCMYMYLCIYVRIMYYVYVSMYAYVCTYVRVLARTLDIVNLTDDGLNRQTTSMYRSKHARNFHIYPVRVTSQQEALSVATMRFAARFIHTLFFCSGRIL
jgi:hypothetical protein